MFSFVYVFMRIKFLFTENEFDQFNNNNGQNI